MNVKRIVIIGATSGIGLEVAKIYIRRGWRVGVAGRRVEELRKLKAQSPDLVEWQQVDVTTDDAVKQVEMLVQKLGGMDLFLLSSGIGWNNPTLEAERELITLRTNGLGFTRMMTFAYNYFKMAGGGHVAAISSIAGTKGLGAAPAYSASKRFQNHYLDCLAQLARIDKLPIQITDIRPGFVRTDLISGKNYPMIMSSQEVASSIVKALDGRKRRVVIDWRYALLVFFWRCIPQWLWERLSIK